MYKCSIADSCDPAVFTFVAHIHQVAAEFGGYSEVVELQRYLQRLIRVTVVVGPGQLATGCLEGSPFPSSRILSQADWENRAPIFYLFLGYNDGVSGDR